MTQYVAFLRGVNVGGHNLLKMKYLRQYFISSGSNNVSSYKQSGNIIFETSGNDPYVIEKKIEKELFQSTGANIQVFLRTMPQIRGMVALDPFKDFRSDTTKLFVTFLSNEPSIKPGLPLRSPGHDVEVICIRNSDAFSIAYENKGRFGAPNGCLEAPLKLYATTLNWNTIKRIAILK